MYPNGYFYPGTSVHFFCMFFPYLAMTKRPFFQLLAIALWFTGPVLASIITPAVNEQAAIWCLYSVVQAAIFVVVGRTQNLFQQQPPSKLVLPGKKGEDTLVYVRYTGAHDYDGTMNGSGHHHVNGNGNGHGHEMVDEDMKSLLLQPEESKAV